VPRAGQVRPPVPERLGDRVAIGALTSVFPPGLVDRVLAECGRTEQRRRLLPARMVVYYVLALALFAEIGYVEVLRLLVEALRRPAREQAALGRLPVKSALVQARARLGPEPLRALFAAAARPLATPATPGAWYRGWRLGALDGTTLDVADTPANDAAFGRANSGRGEGTGAFPQVRVVGLVECGTHATVGAVLGPYGTGEVTLAGRLLGGLEEGALAGVLLLADRLFVGAALWRTAHATGAELLWRAKTGKTAPKLPVDQVLADGSWLSRLYAAGDRRKRHPIVVRVVEYTLSDPGRPQAAGEVYRLVTTILDPEHAPAAELAALYAERWEQESVLDELKTHQRGAQVVLRSKSPDMVAQEVWAHLLVHYAIRALIHQAALEQDLDPDRLSFTGTLRIVRRHLASHAAFSP
jgi:Insertion element 4 transposase N-terminal/Transposase DDE domain